MQKILFITILSFTSIIYSQPRFIVGFRGELSFVDYNVDNQHISKLTIPFIQNFYIPIGIKFNERTLWEIRPGLMFAGNNYEGIELGASFSYFINQTNLFVGGGINFHFNKSTDGNEGFYGNNIALLNVEVGYTYIKKTSFILSFQYPTTTNYGFHGSTELARNIEHEVNFITKLGMVFWLN